MNEFQLRNASSKWNWTRQCLTDPIGEDDVGDPGFQDGPLLGFQCVELKPHTEGRVAIDNLRLGLKRPLVAKDFDGDRRSNSERGQRIDIAAAETDFGGARDELGPSTRFDDLR